MENATIMLVFRCSLCGGEPDGDKLRGESRSPDYLPTVII
jgi:hypothetical protein